MRFWASLVLICVLSLYYGVPQVEAYYNNIPADVVIGQPNFTTTGGTATASTLPDTAVRGLFVDPRGRLIVADRAGNRVLIWNQIPTQNGQPADLVLGQPNFTSTTANVNGRSAQTLSSPGGVYSDGDRLFVHDRGNSRVLIWNTFPTQNQQAANVVVGQADMTSHVTGCWPYRISSGGQESGVWVHDGKLLVGSNNQGRILVWNTIPTTNDTSADVVIGQPDMTTCSSTSTPTQRSLNSPRGFMVDNRGRLIVADGTSANRVLIWNSIPTTNYAPADVVIGQPNFTSNSTVVTGSSLNIPLSLYSNGERLYIPDNNNNRVLIYNRIPTSNGMSADLVLGQENFTSNTTFAASVTTLLNPQAIFEYQDKLLVADANDRILVFSNNRRSPGLSLQNSPEMLGNELLFRGEANVQAPYAVQQVEVSVNGGTFQNAQALDGRFNSSSENFFFQFAPETMPLKNDQGQHIDGYTLQVRSSNNNADKTDHLFYFSPFVLNGPADSESVDTSYPTFDFAVNKKRLALRDNLSHFVIQVKDRNLGSDWTTYIDQIPVDFASRKNDVENVQHSLWQSLDVLEGQYETDRFLASYADGGSRVIVRSKIQPLGGTYEWRVVAVDKSGHIQETGARTLIVGGGAGSITPGFPLAVLNISGLGNPNISSYNLASIKKTYSTSSSAPTFYGIAWSGAKVTLQLTEQNCTANCTQTFSTDANFMSRWGINLPAGSLKRGKTYQTTFSVQHDQLFTQLPTFLLSVK